jgi:hypothetical protein
LEVETRVSRVLESFIAGNKSKDLVMIFASRKKDIGKDEDNSPDDARSKLQ